MNAEHVSVDGVFSGSSVLGQGVQHVHHTYHLHAPLPAVRPQGPAALASRDYAAAAEAFRALLLKQPVDASAHFGLALALLGGRHPCRCSVRVLERVTASLRSAVTAAPGHRAARLALLLIRDAELSRWGRQRRRLTREDRRLLTRIAPASARELATHIPAVESILWQELQKRAADDTASSSGRSRRHRSLTEPKSGAPSGEPARSPDARRTATAGGAEPSATSRPLARRRSASPRGRRRTS